MVNEKRSSLEKQKIIETRIEEIIRLEDMIKNINEDCQKIEGKMSELET